MSSPNVRGTVEEKKARFQAIIDNGRDLFVHESERGFTTNELARRVNLKQASLYKYIVNKRDLWFAIVSHDLDELFKYFKDIIDTFTGSSFDLPSLIVEKYFDFAIANEDKIHLLHRISPPNSSSHNPGPFEMNYNPSKYYAVFSEIIKNFLKDKTVTVQNPTFFMFYIYSIAHGATLLIGARGFTHDPTEFKKYILDQLNHLLNSYKTEPK